MFRSKDFYLKNIYDLKGNRIGRTRDIFINFSRGEVVGIKVSNFTLKGKKNYLDVKKIISFDEDILVTELENKEGLKFSDIKDMEVIDKAGNVRGELEDLIIDEETFKITGLIISGGIIDKIIKGKEIILINQSILGEDCILYLGDDTVVVKNLPREASSYDNYKKA